MEESMGSISAREAQQAHKGQLKWANMLRPDYYKKGRDFAGVAFPVIYIKDVDSVTKDDILQGMKKLGAEISYPTLNRYVKTGLVTAPKNVNKGRGKGQISQYPEHALFETFAAWSLISGNPVPGSNGIRLSKEQISLQREEGPLKYSYENIAKAAWLIRYCKAFVIHKYQEENLQFFDVSICFVRVNPDEEINPKDGGYFQGMFNQADRVKIILFYRLESLDDSAHALEEWRKSEKGHWYRVVAYAADNLNAE
jgi:hypothetical protein